MHETHEMDDRPCLPPPPWPLAVDWLVSDNDDDDDDDDPPSTWTQSPLPIQTLTHTHLPFLTACRRIMKCSEILADERMLHGVLRQLLVGKHYIACRNLLKALGNNEHLRNEFGVLCVLASLPSADSWLYVLHDARRRCDVLPSSSNSATTTTHRRNIARGAVAAGMLHMLKDTAEVGAFLESGLTEAEREAILVVLL